MNKVLKVISPLILGLIGGFISINFLNQSAVASKNLKIVEAEEFRLVDKNGNVRGGMKSLDDGSSLISIQGVNDDKSGIRIEVNKTGSSFKIYNKEGRFVTQLGFNSKSRTSSLSFLNANGFDMKNPTFAEVTLDNSEKHFGLEFFSENKPMIGLGTDSKKDNPGLFFISKSGKSNSLTYLKDKK